MLQARRRITTVHAQGCITGCFGFVLIAVIAVVLWLARGWIGGDAADETPPSTTSEVDQSGPRAILNRAWFDRLPEQPRDEVYLWVWLAGGVGIAEHGSYYRTSFEVFDFERRGDALDMQFLQDKKQLTTSFRVTACDDVPPFDLCLDLAKSPRGPKRLYGFGNADDFARHVPWGTATLRAMEEHARAPRGR